MTASILPQDRTARRTVKALTIVARQECEPLDEGSWRVRDIQTGSGRWHIVLDGRCDCEDHTRRAAYCKHLQSVALEEQTLTQYAANWNSRAEQARAALDDLPGDFLDTALNFADVALTADRLGDHDRQPRCPDCTAPLVSQSYHVGGKGLTCFLVCSKDGQHKALPA